MLSVKIYNKEDFDTICNYWQMVDCGEDMTFFQRYEWYAYLNQSCPKDCQNYLSVYIIIFQSETPVLIAPLWIVRRTFNVVNKKGAYIIGKEGYSDYLNLIYKDFCVEAFRLLLATLKKEYGIHIFHFDNLRENTKLYAYIKSAAHIKSSRICVALHIESTSEKWFKGLRKSAKQNIRTAKNRCKANNIEIQYAFDAERTRQTIEQCVLLKKNRDSQKNSPLPLKDLIRSKIKEKKIISSLRHFLTSVITLQHIKQRYYYHLPIFNPLTSPSNTKLMLALSDNKIIAFFLYGLNKERKEIVVLTAGFDEAYKRYSPGILLMEAFVKMVMDDIISDYKIIDFTRGTEKYKYDLGGLNHTIYSMSYRFNI